MNTEEVKAGQPIRVGEFTLVPMERTLVSCVGVKRGVVVRGSKSPVGIVVVSAEDTRALDLNGKEVPLEHYLKEVPDLAPLLKRLQTVA